MVVEWKMLHPRARPEHLGLMRAFLSDANPAKAADQLHSHYSYGGGWRPQPGFSLGDDGALLYPGDPPLRPVAEAQLRDEVVRLYEHSFVAVIQPDQSLEVCRMD